MRNISFQLTSDQVRRSVSYIKDELRHPTRNIPRPPDFKCITRRLNWLNLKEGDLLQGCEKCMGRRHGEPLVKLAVIRVKSVKREPLNYLTLHTVNGPGYVMRKILIENGMAYTAGQARHEVNLEGFPLLTPKEFVDMFCRHMKCKPDTIITRIVFDYETAP